MLGDPLPAILPPGTQKKHLLIHQKKTNKGIFKSSTWFHLHYLPSIRNKFRGNLTKIEGYMAPRNVLREVLRNQTKKHLLIHQKKTNKGIIKYITWLHLHHLPSIHNKFRVNRKKIEGDMTPRRGTEKGAEKGDEDIPTKNPTPCYVE